MKSVKDEIKIREIMLESAIRNYGISTSKAGKMQKASLMANSIIETAKRIIAVFEEPQNNPK